MARLLRLDASARTQDSHSRDMADYFQRRWLDANPDDELIVRNLSEAPIPHIDAMTIAGFYTGKDQHTPAMRSATALSDTLIEELLSADALLISTPMYNFSVPSALKAYIDQVVRIGHTFEVTEAGLSGLIRGKSVYVVSAAGAVFSDAAMEGMDFLEPYLKTVLSFLGMREIVFFALEGTSTDPAALARSEVAARQGIDALFVM